MKKFVLLLAAAVALSASAFNMTTTGIRQVNKKATIHPERMVPNTVNASKGMKQVKKQVQRFNSAVIDQQPAGEMKTYNRTGGAFYYDSGLAIGYQSGKAYVVFGEGNKVYLKDPVYGLQYGTWVEGTLSADGTTITVPLGQTLYNPGEDYDYEMLLSWGSTTYTISEGDDSSVSITFTKDNTVTEAIYTIDGDNIYLEGTEGDLNQDFPEYCVMSGLCGTWSDDDTWQGCVDFGTTYTLTETTEAPTLITVQPEGELVEYNRSGECFNYDSWYGLYLGTQDGKAYVVYGDNNKVYLLNPVYGAATNVWVEGTLSADGTTITVPLGQFISWSNDYQYGMTIRMATIGVDAEGNLTTTVDDDTEVTYTINGNTITLNGTYGDISLDWPSTYRGLAAIWNDDLNFSGYMDWKTVYHQPITGPAVPANPRLDAEAISSSSPWYDGGDEDGYSRLSHLFVYEDVDGNPLNADNMTFSIYTDDNQLFTFDYATYGGTNEVVTEDMTEIPCNTSSYDFSPSVTYFYRTNAEGFTTFFNERIGIQVFYTADGVKNHSDIVYWSILTNSIEVVDPDAQEPEGMRGDVNGDGSVDPADISALIDYLVNGTEVNEGNADCDQDGEISPADISALIDYLLNEVWTD